MLPIIWESKNIVTDKCKQLKHLPNNTIHDIGYLQAYMSKGLLTDIYGKNDSIRTVLNI